MSAPAQLDDRERSDSWTPKLDVVPCAPGPQRDKKPQLRTSTQSTAVSEICSPATYICEAKTKIQAVLARTRPHV